MGHGAVVQLSCFFLRLFFLFFFLQTCIFFFFRLHKETNKDEEDRGKKKEKEEGQTVRAREGATRGLGCTQEGGLWEDVDVEGSLV